jgi:hypothetical protein
VEQGLVIEANSRLHRIGEVRRLGVAGRQTETTTCLDLGLDIANARRILGVGIGGSATEIALDSVFLHKLRDAGDRRLVSVGIEACPLFTEFLEEVAIDKPV